MKKLIPALLLILFLLCSACSGTTYRNNEEIGKAFQSYRGAFENVAVTAAGENSGFIHKPNAEEQEADCGDSGYKLMEADGLHIHLQREMSDTELRHIAEAALSLMENVDIESISFSQEAVRFHLKDENEYSWAPTVVYWRADDADEGEIGYGEAVRRLADHWYAALITR